MVINRIKIVLIHENWKQEKGKEQVKRLKTRTQKESRMAAPTVEGAAVTALRSVLHRVRQAAERSGRTQEQIRVVAVSKTKPVSLIRQVYDAGHRSFGENYVQEIVDKAPQVHW